MRLSYNQQKPSIHIYYNESLNNISDFKEIFWGIEEEGIPYEIQLKEHRDAVQLAYAACEQSVLGVGIGVDCESIIIHYIKLKKDKPLYEISTSSNDFLMRTLGVNAARLVKRIPFKNIEDHEVEDNICLSKENLEEEIRTIVKRIIARMKLG
ncbi:glycerol dehydratase reactivase beta/small subunit family protein [Crassaminicella profunda]|uniref:glycerol dehydratase reactivase beta/small subunit family protein n=1 Tax=Crassaminicella profunda TaxID=1286698 RepID=UPI001CA70464|nr:glycerol dehydratase reactivase beta/small subunit family protein [Crassaminicella profunda]QZY54140.1 glycerol dehydratase reactivase beta/small subunit family protein [Crassaminicella profunda]